MSSNGRGPAQSFEEYQLKTADAWQNDDATSFIVDAEVSQKVAQEILHIHRTNFKDKSHESSKAFASQAKPHFESRRKLSSASSSSGGNANKAAALPHKPAPGVGVRQDMPIYSSRPSVQSLPQNEVDRLGKFKALIAGPVTDLEKLRALSWSGIPLEVRHTVWKLLGGYLPPNVEVRQSVVNAKRSMYFEFGKKYFSTLPPSTNLRSQIQKDLVRMSALHEKQQLQNIFERILSIWSLKHPASDYVQGFNDLVMPFFVVFLSEYVPVDLDSSQDLILTQMPTTEQFDMVEADTFWCLSTLLDGIHDRYTFAQPGIQLAVKELSDLVERIDNRLHLHLISHSVEYLQFAFRWMNNLLMRELPLRCVIRLWDTYQAEQQGFSKFHIYVCASLLLSFKNDIEERKDFQSLLLFLQNLPTTQWTDENVSVLLSWGFYRQCLFSDAPHHLNNSGNKFS